MGESLNVAPRADERPRDIEDWILVGNPNVGKSALFGAMTGAYVTVSNYPGTTVEVAYGTARVGDRKIRVTDTPGTNSFLPMTDDERVTRDAMLDLAPGTAVVAVGDAKNPRRTALLAIQLAEMEVPFALALNMTDEARARGIAVDADRLSRAIGAPVVPTVAVRDEGVEALKQAASDVRGAVAPVDLRVVYPDAVEHALAEIEPLLPMTSVAPRALAVLALCGDRTLLERLRAEMAEADYSAFDRIRGVASQAFREPLQYVINRSRVDVATRIASEVSKDGGRTASRPRWLRTFERATTHPLWGLPILAVVLWLAYRFVGVFGAGTLVDTLETGLFEGYVNPIATRLVDAFVPFAWVRDMLVGEYGIVTMALTYSLALVFPIVGTFFLAFGALEDSGYLPRLAVMLNRAFRLIGLNGKAVLPMVLGLGCDTMATLTTRVLETRKERLVVIILLALGVPCSAQLTVILAMLASMSGLAVMIWLGVVLGVLLLVGRIASSILPGRGSDFILELPPLRMPRIGNIVSKTLGRIEWYLKEAVPLFVLGTLILFFADRLKVLGAVQRFTEPVLKGMLGLPVETAESFIIGFLRRDFGAAGLYHLAEKGALDAVQIVVSVVVITLFIPCIADFFMIVKERGVKTGLAIAAFIFPFALLVGAALNAVLRAVPIPL